MGRTGRTTGWSCAAASASAAVADEARRFWEVRSDVFDACVAAIAPGVPSSEIAVARDRALAEHGYPAVPGLRYTAHGLGLDSLEPPWVPGKDAS